VKPTFNSPLEDWSAAVSSLGLTLLIKRDDLLPFPLAGNKFRKLSYELEGMSPGTQIITVGAVTSNHCRISAFMAARLRCPIHLLLHAHANLDQGEKVALRLLQSLGATYEIIEPKDISARLANREKSFGPRPVHLIEGGCHTPRGVMAYAEAVAELEKQLPEAPDVIVVASGTGATQAGLILGCQRLGWRTDVLGVSVARSASRGEEAVREALAWHGAGDLRVNFTDAYRGGGYGKADSRTHEALAWGWARGLPLDLTYTGKAMAAVLDLAAKELQGKSVLLWHTGGLFTYLTQPNVDEVLGNPRR
jgi:D-cysteine desulfhydrase